LGLRSLLKFIGKGDRKVAAVFAQTPETCHRAVVHLRAGAPDVDVWLFSTQPVPAETAALCAHVAVGRRSLALLLSAERQLWPYWVAITVTTWTGSHGKWALKLAPFFIPPFRGLILNENDDFLNASPSNILGHTARRLRDLFHSGWHTVQDRARGYWRLVSYHIWRSGPVNRVRDKFAGLFALCATLLLRILATILGWCGYPYRSLFHKLRGSAQLTPPLIATTPAAGIARFIATGKHWDGRKFEAFVSGNPARWILWEEGEHSGNLEPIVHDPNTFAVSVQTSFRAWKPMLFPTAPFRTLQPEEASHVIAPLAGRILVDREKLLALGVPRTSLAETAWMILFWKAAAAGWRCYSAGQEGKLAEQPDLPIPETGFMLRFLTDSALRTLGPREPELGRGAIAFAPGMQTKFAGGSGRLKVLLVSPFLPYPLSHGGAVRIYNLCRALAGRVDFTLIAIREAQDHVDYQKLHEVFRNVYILDKDERPSGSEDLPAQVREHQSTALTALIREIAREWKPDLLQVEYTHMAAIRDAVPDVPAILVEHDLTFSLYRQLAEKQDAPASARREYEKWLRFEKHWLHAYNVVWTMSEEDRAIAAAEGGRAPAATFNIPNGVDIDRFVPRDEPTDVPEILYVGSFRHLPNILGFLKLRDEIMPRVWQERGDVRLRVIGGPQHALFWSRFTKSSASPVFDSRVEVHDFVEDLRPLYAKASVVVVPLEVSAGTNIKVLEAMACGKAVVTTTIGCAGLGLRDRKDLFIDDDWAAFARSVVELLTNASIRNALATQARKTAVDHFSWKAIADTAYESYAATLSRQI